MILYRQPNSTTFTSVIPARLGSVAYSLPTISFNTDPITKMKLAPETWREMGCPDALSVTAAAEPEPGPEPIYVRGTGG